jgi:hypothetical protein
VLETDEMLGPPPEVDVGVVVKNIGGFFSKLFSA